jgi:hypothetical protein
VINDAKSNQEASRSRSRSSKNQIGAENRGVQRRFFQVEAQLAAVLQIASFLRID